MAHIALIGGHGKVALLATPALVGEGHTVDSVIRNPEQADEITALGATPVVADVEQLDEAGIQEIVTGHDMVIWSAGAGPGSPERTYAVDRDAAIRTIDAAAAAGVPRLVMVSYFGAGPGHGVPPDSGFFAYAESKTAADAHLQDSVLAWTVLRPSGLTEDPPTGAIQVAGPGVEGATVSRADVAEVIVHVAGRTDLAGRTIEFNSGSTPIAEALSG